MKVATDNNKSTPDPKSGSNPDWCSAFYQTRLYHKAVELLRKLGDLSPASRREKLMLDLAHSIEHACEAAPTETKLNTTHRRR